ncbi:putative mfs transporter [Phaeomoniella chlamydospora]|uniref:Putative mfs transporter n=1 Tax=Phaeomoniella chlamydospora TaxID=158046 RepID=A0A0G2ECW3_PHACM|nr:putative mfs transporter [Phaeomoniella chlamydospora]
MPLGVIDTKGTAPGTVLLQDGEGISKAQDLKHGAGKSANIVLVPQPSSDPNDPLNWPRWKKDTVFFVIFFSTIVLAAVPAPILSSAVVVLSLELGKSLNDISELSGYQLLVVGCFGPIVCALATKYGKRPQFVFASIMAVIGTAICVGARDKYDMLFAGRLIQGFGTTAFESLSVAALGDIYFVHERPMRTGIMVLTLTCVSALAAIIGGPITEHLGWRYLFIIHLPFVVICCPATVFFLPETQYTRQVATPSASQGDVQKPPSSGLRDDKISDTMIVDRSREAAEDSLMLPKKTFRQELSLYNGSYSQRNLVELAISPLLTLLNPSIMWVSCALEDV